MSTTFTDKNGNELIDGDKVILTVSMTTGERKSGRNYFSNYTKREVVFTVRFGEFKGQITYFLETDEVESYDTHFYSGCGRTRAERRANEITRIERNLSRVLTREIAQQCEKVSLKLQTCKPPNAEI